MLGAVMTNSADYHNQMRFMRKAVGLQPGPADAYHTWQGMRTMELRLAQQQKTAFFLARTLEAHPRVRLVRYPFLPSHPQHDLARRQMRGGGTLVSLEIETDRRAIHQFVKALSPMFVVAHSMGSVESTVSHPATMSHAALTSEERLQAGISDSLVRLSVGIENEEDISNAVLTALKEI